MIIGTVPYMSPEQARGAVVDARSDIWSLGCLIYEMLACRSPFAGPTTSDVLIGILDKEPAPLIAPPHNVPAEYDWIIAKTLRNNADERYQKTEELLSDVRRLQEKLSREVGALAQQYCVRRIFTRSRFAPPVRHRRSV